MLQLAGEAGLRRGEVAQVHRDDLIEIDRPQLVVHGKGGKQRVIPISDYLTQLIRDGAPKSWLFPNGSGGHLTSQHVGKLVAQALPDHWTIHTLRHRFATRAYRSTRNLRAVQTLLGHESVMTTERYTALDDSEIRATAAGAW
jgi:integrase